MQIEEQKVNMDKEMYTMDPEQDDDMGVVVEEGGGGIGMQPTSRKSAVSDVTGGADEDGEGDVDDDMYADLDGKGDDYGGEWDAYEQEV